MEKHIWTVIEYLNRVGYQAYPVGGCVRDRLLGVEPEDLDVATNARPEEVKQVFDGFNVIETGIKHGTVTVMMEEEPVEITTFRKESTYSDGRHPDRVEFSDDLIEDLKRRDFTINAMALSNTGEVIDPFGGREDLEKGLIRAVGDPYERFNEDGLRIMRALRFASKLGFDIEEGTREAIFKCRELLENISAERLAMEFNGIITGDKAYDVLKEFWPVIAQFIPEIEPMVGFDQRNKHHIYDVYEHSLHAMSNVAPAIHLRLAALFHDIGKPWCFSLDDKGVGHFYGHSDTGEEIAREILNRLKYDNETKHRVLTLIEWHDRNIEGNPKAVKRALNKLGEEMFFDLLMIKRADNLAQAPEYRGRQKTYDELEDLATEILREGQCFNRAGLAIDGRDLMELGIPAGPEIGRILDGLVTLVVEGEIENTREALLKGVSGIHSHNFNGKGDSV